MLRDWEGILYLSALWPDTGQPAHGCFTKGAYYKVEFQSLENNNDNTYRYATAYDDYRLQLNVPNTTNMANFYWNYTVGGNNNNNRDDPHAFIRWRLTECADPGGSAACPSGSNYGLLEVINTYPLPQIDLSNTPQCLIINNSSLVVACNNLVGSNVQGETYAYFWLDELQSAAQTVTTYSGPAIRGTFTPTAVQAGDLILTLGKDVTNRSGTHTLCIDFNVLTKSQSFSGDLNGYGDWGNSGGFAAIDRTTKNTGSGGNCIDVTVKDNYAGVTNTACTGTPPVFPPDCLIKFNGICGGSPNKAPDCTAVNSGFPGLTLLPIPAGSSSSGGCPNATPYCCSSPCHHPTDTDNSCGSDIGSAYCCQDATGGQCIIKTIGHKGIDTVGTCVACSQEGGACNDGKNSCCTGSPGFMCDTSDPKKPGVCHACVQLGGGPCNNSDKQCCIGGGTCTNGGTTCSLCQTGADCSKNGDADCCAGQVCNGTSCVAPSPTPPGEYAPSFPPVNWCQNGSCNTALGLWHYDPSGFIQDLFSIVLSFAGGIAFLTLLYAGYRYMASQGNPEQLQTAKELATAAVVGLLFCIFCLVLFQAIGVDILHIPGITP